MMTRKSPPHLEIVAGRGAQDDIAGEMPQEALPLERRRRPRISLSTEQIRLARNGKVFSVSDLSTGGLAIRILDAEDFHLFPVAAEFEGVLNLRGERVAVKARVRNLQDQRVGCEFEELDDSARGIVARFLDPGILGRELRPIPSSEPGMTWYHGPSGTDLLIKRGVDGQVRRFTAFVLGSFMQWDSESGVSTGRATEGRDPGETWGIVQVETLLLDPDRQPDAGKLNIAKALILSSNVPEDLKGWLVRRLENS